MYDTGFAGCHLKTKILLLSLVCLTLAALVLTLPQLAAFSFQQMLVLTLTLGVTTLVGRHQIRIPYTSAQFTIAETVVFWSILWLGAPGAVLVALSTGFALHTTAEENILRRLFDALSQALAAFLAAGVFYLVLQQTAQAPAKILGTNPLPWPTLALALTAAAAAHYTLSGALKITFFKFESIYAASALGKTAFLQPAIVYPLTVAAALALHAAFLEFDLAFGWIVVPLAVISHFAYRIHHKKLAQKTREIVEASRVHLATVEALATAIDARDQMGFGHVRRTQVYAVGLGEILGLSDEEIQALNTGALLHDIGKLAVPDHILNKPGRLTPAELEKTKIHPSVGASIIAKVGFGYPVVPTVKYHHENWDGTGYPDGLKGKEIPLTARILSVADHYDTLRAARPYRPPISREEARKCLISRAGTYFDPKIVDVFLRNLSKLELRLAKEGLFYKEDEAAAAKELLAHRIDNNSKNYVEQIKRANREVYALYELARVFSSSLNLDETLALFGEKVGELLPFDTLVVYLFDEKGSEAKAVYTEGKNAAALLGRSIAPGEGATGYVLKNRQPVCNVNPALDFSFCGLDLVQEYSAMVSLPLVAEEKILGAISLYSCALENYEDEHLRLLETASLIAADTISKSLHHAETETRALTDPMTGLPNARSLQMQFDKEVGRASRHGLSFQVLMLDLDGFKSVNDTFGHKIGDKMLKEIAKVMRLQLREYDFLARYAGDEFVALIPETDNISVEDLCLRLEKAVRDFVLPVGDNQFARVGVSIGAAGYPQGGELLDQILIAADKAMYRVKTARKKRRLNEWKKLQGMTPPTEKEMLLKPLNASPITVRPTDAAYQNHALGFEASEETFHAEVEENQIISSAIN